MGKCGNSEGKAIGKATAPGQIKKAGESAVGKGKGKDKGKDK